MNNYLKISSILLIWSSVLSSSPSFSKEKEEKLSFELMDKHLESAEIFGEDAKTYQQRINTIQDYLDPKKQIYSLCIFGPSNVDCDEEDASIAIREFMGWQKTKAPVKELCNKLSSQIYLIQKFRQKGKPFQLFIEDEHKADSAFPNNSGAFPRYLVSYIFNKKNEIDAKLLASYIELQCLRSDHPVGAYVDETSTN